MIKKSKLSLEKSEPTSFRLKPEIRKKLDESSIRNDIATNKLVNDILEDHFAWNEFGSKLGLMIMLRSFYIGLMDSMDRDTIIELAQTAGKEDLKILIQFVHGKITLDSIMKEMEMYFKKIKVTSKKIVTDKKIEYLVKNDLGLNWPYYVVTIINSVLLDIGYKVYNTKYEKKCFTFQITKK